MPEFIVELFVVVDAPSSSEAERYGEQLAAKVRRGASKRVLNVLLSDIRNQEEDDDADA